MHTSAIWVGVKVWLATVFFNAVLFTIGICWNAGIKGVLGGFVFLFLGCLVSSPLLLLIVPVINLSRKIPYSIPARISWMGFWLSALIVIFYACGDWLFTGRFFSFTIDLFTVSSVTILALVLSILLNRKGLRRLNEAAEEKTLSTYTIQ